ncbi:MAG: restriction endonuclease [Rhodoferax sp.]
MSDKSLFALLLRSPWWISIVLAMVIALIAGALLPAPYSAVGTLCSLPFVVIGIVAAWRQRRAPNRAQMAQVLEQIAAMSWREFSVALTQVYVSKGYTVTQLGTGAADLKLQKDGQATLVSARRWKAAAMGIEPVRELVAAKQSADASSCICISLRPVTDKARRFAEDNSVKLISDMELAALITESR